MEFYHHLTPENLWPYALVFCRMLGLFLFMPGFSEFTVPYRIRVLLTVGTALTMTPLLQERYVFPSHPFLEIFIQELLLGVFFGVLTQAMLLILDIAGSAISYQISMTNVLINVKNGAQYLIVSQFFVTVAVVFIFCNDMHHAMIRGVVVSYEKFPIHHIPSINTLTDFFFRKTEQGFAIAVQIASPFFVAILAFRTAMGLLMRLVPQVQVYFIAQPSEILVGFLILFVTVASMLRTFLEYFNFFS